MIDTVNDHVTGRWSQCDDVMVVALLGSLPPIRLCIGDAIVVAVIIMRKIDSSKVRTLHV